MTNITSKIFLFAASIGAWGCSPHTTPEAAAALNKALASVVGKDDIRNGAMWVFAPEKGLDHGFAHGVANADTGRKMTVDTPFLTASVGKLFVAAAVVRLAEQGELSLDDPITRWIPPRELSGLPVFGGDAALSKITVRMLLGHRSGLPCYFSDKSADGSPRLFDLISEQRQRTWTRTQLLDYLRAHYEPLSAPGTEFHYSDTGYDLLGLVLEGVKALPFQKVVRTLVLDPLGLKQTWYHSLEASPAGVPPISDVFIGRTNMHSAPSLSADQAGGGLATTLYDLKTFLQKLVEGEPVALTSLATDWTEDAMINGIDVGLPAWRIRPGGIFFALAGLPELVGHSGATGVWAYYAKESNAILVGVVNQSSWQENHVKFLLKDVLPVVQRTKNVNLPGS
jgi:D-alanyl-D-alanine carboxypeptidase